MHIFILILIFACSKDMNLCTLTGLQDPITIDEEPPIVVADTVNTFAYIEEFFIENESVTTREDSAKIINTPKAFNDTNCVTSSAKAGDEGLKTWCWGDFAKEINGLANEAFIDDGKLFTSVHYYNQAENYKPVEVLGSRIHFRVNPNSAVPYGSKDTHNYRSEVRDAPWDVNHPVGTEQWWGFDYLFGDEYVPDELPWIMWQTHGSFSNPVNPMTSLQIGPTNYGRNTNGRGELFVTNHAISTKNAKFTPTGIIPQAGQTLNIVIHMVWGQNDTGLYQVWVDGVKVYDEQERTVYVEHPEGGYWKLGIYKWRWKDQSNINISASRGISELKTSIGPLKVIKKSPSNPTYMADEYNTVKPN